MRELLAFFSVLNRRCPNSAARSRSSSPHSHRGKFLRLAPLSGAGLLWIAATAFASPLETNPTTTADHAHAKPNASALWSLLPLAKVAVPESPTSESQQPIDRFVRHRLNQAGLALSPRASREVLLRRVSLDLTGLPPSPEEVDQFLSDTRPDAWQRVVDRLLQSPHYGERQARAWLDLARYAESEGFKADETRPNAWRYRDYVIQSLNQDKPYAQFIAEQIAGDELWPGQPEAFVATGFNRHYPDESNARNLMQRRQEILNDITDTVGSVFLGLTYACARCHDHKWDPISQADYYRLQAFFAGAAAADSVPLVSEEQRAAHQAQLRRWEERTQKIRQELAELEEPHRVAIIRDYVEKYPDPIQTALNKPDAERTPFERQMAAKAKLYIDPESHQYIATSSTIGGRLKGDAKKRWETLRKELAAHASEHPGKLPLGTGICDLGERAPETHILKRGAYDAPRETVQPGLLAALGPVGSPSEIHPVSHRSSGRRTALAKLLTHPENPLPARVLVNRVWQSHFGRGLVASPSDFGRRGATPTHPELLDWLAQQFLQNGGSLKKLHRLILTSETYQQAARSDSSPSPAQIRAAEIDPENHLLWHAPRLRLEGEFIRDSALAVSGRLNPALGGPSVFPELPPGMDTRGGWKASERPEDRQRRSIYVFVRRNMRYPMFEAFDMPDTHESCARRNITTSPIQALTLFNSGLSHDWARAFAERVLRSAGTQPNLQIESAWRLAYARRPDARELALAQQLIQHSPAPASPSAAPCEPSSGLIDLCHALLNSNEFVYRP